MKKIEWKQMVEDGWYSASWRIFHFRAAPEPENNDRWEFSITTDCAVLFREVYDSKEALMEDASWRVFSFLVNLAHEWAERPGSI